MAAIVHITGSHGYQEVLSRAPEHIDYLAKPFISAGVAPLFGAADIVITRAGATTMQELAAMAKAVIIIPNPYLTGGHQLKNAEVYAKESAAVIVDEDELVANTAVLRRRIEELLKDARKRAQLGARLHRFAKPDAAVDTAALIVEAVATRKHQESVQ
jgi:UDP-N-acetylglucosamine--N-acetylmuramyl-(pentapeptide) pyrophosphoryl-undecaprenol N-acetylglucosamine transferase